MFSIVNHSCTARVKPGCGADEEDSRRTGEGKVRRGRGGRKIRTEWREARESRGGRWILSSCSDEGGAAEWHCDSDIGCHWQSLPRWFTGTCSIWAIISLNVQRMKNSSSLWVLLIGRAICINRGHLDAVCVRMPVCADAVVLVREHSWVFMDSRTRILLSSKQKNKVLKNDKDLWILLAAGRDLASTVTSIRYIWSCSRVTVFYRRLRKGNQI